MADPRHGARKGKETGPLPEIPLHPVLGDSDIGEFARGRKRLELIADIAMGEWSYAELAEATGLTMGDVAMFADEHSRDIGEVRAALAGQLARETAGLWITKKQNRLAELQGMYDEVSEAQARFNNPEPGWSRSHKDMIKTRLDLLAQVATELGAYPQRQAQPARTGSAVHYIIETDSQDLEAMR